jgi:hypothetical protein
MFSRVAFFLLALVAFASAATTLVSTSDEFDAAVRNQTGMTMVLCTSPLPSPTTKHHLTPF